MLTGCGPASRYVVREPYTQMPEYSFTGQSTYFATTCRECAAGCGLVVRTYQGRAIKAEGNKNHPVNLGKTCADSGRSDEAARVFEEIIAHDPEYFDVQERLTALQSV